jgi:TPR repeat protein
VKKGLILFIFPFLSLSLFSQSSEIILRDANSHYSKKEFHKAKKLYEQIAKNSAMADYMLALIFINGYDVERSYSKAFYYLDKAIVKKYQYAYYLKGLLLENGLGCSKNYTKAFKLYQLASSIGKPVKSLCGNKLITVQQLGIPEAQHNLATMYLRGLGTSKNVQKAVQYFKMATERGYTKSELALAFLYYDGIGVASDRTKAFSLFKKVATKGVAIAQYNLGMMYMWGDGIENNNKKAIYWLEKAVSQNYPEAENSLAWFYAEHGVFLDKALQMAKKAVAASPENANYNDTLGFILYKKGLFQKAVSQLNKASTLSPSDAEIYDHLGDVYRVLGKTKKAKEQWQKALELTEDEELKKKIEAKLKKIQ